jgi:O-antigen/teichoic acid export membrane protein
MTITNVLNPIFTYADRFLLGAMASMAAVAHYVVPWEMIVKLNILPIALMGVVFPALAGTYSRDPGHTADLFSRTLRYLYVIMMPVVIAGIGFAPELLRVWLGHEFALESFRVMQWLLLGVLFYGLSRVPFGLLQAIGRPDVGAKFHMLEAPLYLLVLWLLVSRMGVEGAAIAWSLRAVTEAALLMIAAGYFLRSAARKIVANLLIGAATGLGLIFLVLASGPPVVRAGVAVAALAAFVLLSWRVFLQPAERDRILKHSHPRAWRRLLQPSGAA